MKNVTCENKRMGAMRFDYAGSTYTFPPGRFVIDEAIALSAESRLSLADFQIVHEKHRTASEEIPEETAHIDRGVGLFVPEPLSPDGVQPDVLEPQPPTTPSSPPRTAAEAAAADPSLIGRGDFPFNPTPPAPFGPGTETVPPSTGVTWPGVPDPVPDPATPKEAEGPAESEPSNAPPASEGPAESEAVDMSTEDLGGDFGAAKTSAANKPVATPRTRKTSAPKALKRGLRSR